MKTRDVILETALELFNNEGLSEVTLRTIASKMGISQGNLNYHFKKRHEILEALYFKLVQNIDEVILKSNNHKHLLEGFMTISKSMMFCFYEHRFFFLDFASILRQNEKIKTHYITLLKVRETQFASLLNGLKNDGIIREEELPNEYLNLYRRGHIISDFWMSAAQTQDKKLTLNAIDEHFNTMTQGIYPYLTDKGKKEYQDYFNKK
ncbi:TetR/AcrR family transcriptional regulator [Seonamhaeicola sp. ML3]|uniref:TetR/AcrR family transcriptional regulator n=1 Tax=Seonamhaeicola sp. ML3 TaxID=2937786 RepID=UPI00200C829F|nr:TetR/AcrR family transcriptional regulator [Seonamhaeicola sp. ML3]